jgi:hypothetical protein
MSTLTHARRLAALEEAERRLDEPDVVILSGGLGQGVAPYAHAGSLQFDQAPEEPFEQFLARVLAVAAIAEELLVVFGGFPDATPPQIAGSSEFDL